MPNVTATSAVIGNKEGEDESRVMVPLEIQRIPEIQPCPIFAAASSKFPGLSMLEKKKATTP